MNDLSKEIGDFLEGAPIEDTPAEPPELPPEEPPEAPPEEPPPEEPPPEEPPAEPPPEEPPPEVPPEEPPPEEPPEELPPTEREALLLKRIETLTGEKLDIGAAIAGKPPEEPPAEPPAEPPPKEPPAEPKVPNFMGEMTLDDVLDDPEKFTQVMTNVYESARTAAEKQAVEKVLRSIPQLVVNYVSRHAAMSNVVSDFYKDNEDLVGVKRTVAAVANEIAAENPDWEVNKVFDEAAVRSRKVLGMAVKAKATKPPVEPKKPAFQRQGSRGTPPGPGLTGLAKDIEELITEE